MSTNSPSPNPQGQTNTETQSSTSSSPQQAASQTTTENAREQVDQILDQTREGFSFESIADSILKSIGNLWKSLGITNLIDYIAGFFGFSTDSQNSNSNQSEQNTNIPERTYPLKECDVIPEGGKLMYANSEISLFTNAQCSANYQGHKLFKGQRLIIMPHQPQNGSFKIKALGVGADGKYLYIKSDDFTKVVQNNPGARVSRGENAYLTGDSISQIHMSHTAYGEGMPNMSGRYIANVIAGRLGQDANAIKQRRIAFIMGFNDLKSDTNFRSIAAVKETYDQIFSVLVNIKRRYGKEISLNGIFQWKEGAQSVPSVEFVDTINKYIKGKCDYFGFRYVDMKTYTNSAKPLHQQVNNPENFINEMTR